MIQQHIATKIREYLPNVHADEISFDENREQPYLNDVKYFSEAIQTWSHTVLESKKLPTLAHEAQPLTNKYNIETDEGCALRMVVELDALSISIKNNDAGTSALASLKLLELIWNSSILRLEQEAPVKVNTSTTGHIPAVAETTSKKSSSDPKISLYQETINNLKEKYPHCNVNALRLLAATRLNVSKQELDDLDISPE